MVEIGSEKVPHGACLTGVRWGSNAIWTMPIWTDHFSKRGFPDKTVLFRFAMEIEGIFYVAEVSKIRHLDQLFSLDLSLIVASPCPSRLMLWKFDLFDSDEHVHSKVVRAPTFRQHFHSLATDWNRLITACSQLVNSILYLFRQLMTKHSTFRIRSACGNVFGKSLA